MRRANLASAVALTTRRAFFAASVAATLAGAACSGQVDASSDEAEIVGGRAERRFAPVGYLSMETDRSGRSFTPFCTATLLAPRVLATAAHCVHDMKHRVRSEGP